MSNFIYSRTCIKYIALKSHAYNKSVRYTNLDRESHLLISYIGDYYQSNGNKKCLYGQLANKITCVISYFCCAIYCIKFSHWAVAGVLLVLYDFTFTKSIDKILLLYMYYK